MVSSTLMPLHIGWHAANPARRSLIGEVDDEPTLSQKLAVIAALNVTPTVLARPEVAPGIRERRSFAPTPALWGWMRPVARIRSADELAHLARKIRERFRCPHA